MNLLFVIGLAIASGSLSAGQPSFDRETVLETVERLQPGEFIWAPQIAPDGPLLVIVSLATQRAVVYRNGLPIGVTTVSTGQPGHETPVGVFTILQKRVEHYSNLYNNAPMPFMQRLTWGGVALHAGNLPGHPASHGCIRLPREFAERLFGATSLGTTVIVTDQAAVPRVAPSPALFRRGGGAASVAQEGEVYWRPELSPEGPVSVVVSTRDSRAVVLRNGVSIGAAPITFVDPPQGTSVYMLSGSNRAEATWLRVPLPGQSISPASPSRRSGVHVDEEFRANVLSVLHPGSTVVVTADSLRPEAPPLHMPPVLESDPG